LPGMRGGLPMRDNPPSGGTFRSVAATCEQPVDDCFARFAPSGTAWNLGSHCSVLESGPAAPSTDRSFRGRVILRITRAVPAYRPSWLRPISPLQRVMSCSSYAISNRRALRRAPLRNGP
jgi:hypothetical protein